MTNKQSIAKKVKRVRKSAFKSIRNGSRNIVRMDKVYLPVDCLIDEYCLADMDCVTLQDIQDIIYVGGV